jgi:PAS domain S-box-containing protein
MENAQILKDLMDVLPEGVISMDIHGNIAIVNKSATRLLGYNSINLIGKPIYDFTPSFEKENFKQLLRDLKETEIIEDRKVQLYDVKGHLKNLNISVSLLRDAKKKPIGIISVIKDIYDLTSLEKELKALKDFSQNVLNSAGVGIAATDLKGNIVFASKGAIEIFKKPLKEVVGQNIVKISSNPIELNEKFMYLVKNGLPFEYESISEEKGKKKELMNIFSLLTDEKGERIGTIVVFNEISRLKEVESQLKESNAILMKYTSDLESLVGITRNLGSSLEQTEIFNLMSRASKEILDIEISCFISYDKGKKFVLNSLIGTKLKSFKSLDSEMKKGGFYSYLSKLKTPKIILDLSREKSFTLPKKVFTKEFKSGVLVPIFTKNNIFRVLAVFSKGKRIFKREEIKLLQSIGNSGAIAIENAVLYKEVKDFAKDLEIKVRERTAELQQSNKLKDLFIDIMGHDLLKPADIARLSTELIMDLEDDPEKKKILQNILNSNERIIDLIENASVLAKLESGEKLELKEGDLGEVLRSVIKEVKDSAEEKNIKIKLSVEGDFLANINPLIYDVFSNLIGNAVKYGPEEGRVEAKIISEGNHWKISITDNGEGIPDEHKKAIFDRFKRLEKGGVKGTGLGLAIVKRVVIAHQGRAWVEDNPGGGSIFSVEIPKLN